MEIWVIVARLNPLHIWHENLIKNCLKQCEKIVIILWSANIINKDNPLSLKQRKEILNLVFQKVILEEKIEIFSLDDYESDIVWLQNLKNLLKEYLNEKIVFYWWDLNNDFAIKVLKEHKNDFYNIDFVEIKRSIIPISATIVRKLIRNSNIIELKKWINKKEVPFLIKNKDLF